MVMEIYTFQNFMMYGGGGNNFNNIDFQYNLVMISNNNSSLSNNSFNGFTYTPRLYDSAEVLPNTGGGGGSGGGGGTDPSGREVVLLIHPEERLVWK